MASSDSTPPLPLGSAPFPPELNESRTELLNRIQGLKQDLKNWRSKLDTQVKIYRDVSSVCLAFLSKIFQPFCLFMLRLSVSWHATT
ncbi:hypothetical protein Gohar_027158 [Gossypium harknessii]|uniref:Uncharacterized protein n=1 Tax=Gossypium harknessii TaxID=34285 RepID=A0A7J9HTU5_9ROSI|nr:hypothetical protein [Gossypium harknessii]